MGEQDNFLWRQRAIRAERRAEALREALRRIANSPGGMKVVHEIARAALSAPEVQRSGLSEGAGGEVPDSPRRPLAESDPDRKPDGTMVSRYHDYDHNKGEKMPPTGARIEMFKSEKDGQFYNRLVAANNEPLMVSEGFPDTATAEDNVHAIETAFEGSFMQKVDLTGDDQ